MTATRLTPFRSARRSAHPRSYSRVAHNLAHKRADTGRNQRTRAVLKTVREQVKRHQRTSVTTHPGRFLNRASQVRILPGALKTPGRGGARVAAVATGWVVLGVAEMRVHPTLQRGLQHACGHIRQHAARTVQLHPLRPGLLLQTVVPCPRPSTMSTYRYSLLLPSGRPSAHPVKGSYTVSAIVPTRPNRRRKSSPSPWPVANAVRSQISCKPIVNGKVNNADQSIE